MGAVPLGIFSFNTMMKHAIVGGWVVLTLAMMAGCAAVPPSDTPGDTTTQNQGFGPQDDSIAGYEPYSPARMQAALDAGKDVVLFAGATWCPLCNALHKDILATGVPEDVVVLTFDYDSSDALKRQYEVTVQHTLLFLDDQGEVAKKTEKKYTTIAEVVAQAKTLKNDMPATDEQAS